jgi:hypothetical protein
MTQLISKEIRWFLSNNDIKPIERWFENLSTPQKIENDNAYPRQDFYLNMPGVKNLGIKIREPKKDIHSGRWKTKFEIKRQIEANDEIECSNHVKGYANKWQKLSYELTEGGENILSINFPMASPGKDWIRVDKNRIMTQYDAETRRIYQGDDLLNEACNIELTKIKITGKVYYSFGLEAYNQSGNKLDDIFRECCDVVFTSINSEGLTTGHSFSYPEFLSPLE